MNEASHMQDQPRRQQFLNGDSPHVTTAVGLEETTKRLRTRGRSLFTQTVIWLTGLICLALLLGTLTQAWSNSQLMQRVQTAQQQLQNLKDHHDYLTRQVAHYKDPFVIESEARQQLGYVRPGEHPVVIINQDEQGQQSSPQQSTQPAQQGFWQEWWDIFFGN